MRCQRPFATLLLLPLLACSATAAAQAGEPGGTIRAAATMGIDNWSDLGDVQPFLGGSFDDTGFGLDLGVHWLVGRTGPADVLLGFNLGGFFHDSNVRGIEEGEDLAASVVYLAPSVKFAFGSPGGRRLYVDAGIGYYGAAIDEMESDCYFGCDSYEYYDDDTLGGYAGLSADFPLGARMGGVRLTTGFAVHFVDFDSPVELDGASSLDGPIYAFQVGLAWGR
ncbi:MAG: outer membrane beta-barrel protein [Gammaproteobacteria bacterium]